MLPRLVDRMPRCSSSHATPVSPGLPLRATHRGGPYAAGARSDEDRRENLRALNRAAYEVFRRGHVPIIGVNLALPIIEAAGAETYDQIMMPLSLAAGRKVLNMFSYSGAASVYALNGGATAVHNVDGSEEALELAARHASMHDAGEKFTTERADAFQWLAVERPAEYGLVLLDPPALVKAGRDKEEGMKAYHFANRAAMKLVETGGIFVTSSCSHFFTEDDLAFTLRRASVQAGVTLRVLDIVRQAPDHPGSVYFPESAYLKSFVCQVLR